MNDEKEQQLIEDWMKHPVTKDLREFVERGIEENKDALLNANYYFPYEPNKTQESVAGIVTTIRAYSRVMDYLKSAETIKEVKEELSDDDE